MPELPEVETLRRQLQAATAAAGITIETVTIIDRKLGEIPDLSGSRIEAVCRRGKELSLRLSCGRDLAIHLRMTGRLELRCASAEFLPYTRAVIGLNKGRIDLLDVRRFATIKVEQGPTKVEPAAVDEMLLGPIPGLQKKATGRKIPVKALLLDQSLFPGMGNIYACEALYLAGVNPSVSACLVTGVAWERIGAAIPVILREAINCRGTTFSDWRDLYGRPGDYQNHLRVYARAGKACIRCGALIERIKIGGRSTYFCPDCQGR